MKARCPLCRGEGRLVVDVLPASYLGHMINVLTFRPCSCRGLVDQDQDDAVQVLDPLEWFAQAESDRTGSEPT